MFNDIICCNLCNCMDCNITYGFLMEDEMIFSCPNCQNILDFFEEIRLKCTNCKDTFELRWVQSDDVGMEPLIVRMEIDEEEV